MVAMARSPSLECQCAAPNLSRLAFRKNRTEEILRGFARYLCWGARSFGQPSENRAGIAPEWYSWSTRVPAGPRPNVQLDSRQPSSTEVLIQ